MKINKIVVFALATMALLSILLTALWMLLPQKQLLMSEPSIELVKEQHESELMAVKGVVGVGISECQGKPCIEVYLANESSNLRKQIPPQLDGFKVNTKVTGNIEALPQP